MGYQHRDIEQKWQKYWVKNNTYKVETDSSKPKYYVLDMFPYPSGAGLHVGHPLGYIASDIFARYKRLCGFNVLHPMGYDAFGLPAEQYAIQTGQHPSITTEKNVSVYRKQLDQIGLGFDWSREVKTCDSEYYKWTQWAFIQLFHCWYDNKANKARPITDLIEEFKLNGNSKVDAACGEVENFTAKEWLGMSEDKQQTILLDYRLAYLADTLVNWCAQLGTVLANDEVKEGFSVRGGHPVEKKKMRQWSLRISAYSQRLLDGLEKLDWSHSLKEMQRNWIGRSEGADIEFKVKKIENEQELSFKIFTTRPDTIFGVTFMVLAPESDWVNLVTTDEHKKEVHEYLEICKRKSERERMSEVKKVTGVFTGAYCIHPFNGKEIPIWVADYVLAGYGTGAIMAVPAHDSRDYAFARHFNLPITQVVSGGDISEESYDAKDGEMMNSDFLNGVHVSKAIGVAIDEVEKRGLGHRRVNFRLRDAIFSRQRYWGEPFPIYYKNDLPYTMDEKDLPLELPEVDKYLPTEEGEPPLGRAQNWKSKEGYPLELSTMPGFAGSSAYYTRYMDPHNRDQLVSKESNEYWRNVDLYVGGSEHATGHLMYARFWNMFLFDIGQVCEEEPFKKLINQGMIQGRSNFVYRIKQSNKFVSLGLKDQYDVTELHVDVSLVKNDVLDIEGFKKWRPEFKGAEFVLENGKYNCGYSVEKMSKSKFNVVNPDDIVVNYGADTLRLYEMFLGPIEQSKPWGLGGIEGVHRFLIKTWKLFYNQDDQLIINDEKPNQDELKVLHTLLKKIKQDIEAFSLNTAVSSFMICVNDLGKMKCHKREVLKPFTIALASFAPHLSEELWQALGHSETIFDTKFPEYKEEYLIENSYSYPISVNGKMKFLLDIPLNLQVKEIESMVMNNEKVQSLLEGKDIKKVIIVPKKIVNLVVK